MEPFSTSVSIGVGGWGFGEREDGGAGDDVGVCCILRRLLEFAGCALLILV